MTDLREIAKRYPKATMRDIAKAADLLGVDLYVAVTRLNKAEAKAITKPRPRRARGAKRK